MEFYFLLSHRCWNILKVPNKLKPVFIHIVSLNKEFDVED